MIVFYGYAAYNLQLDHTIGYEKSLAYGYPLAAIGTVVLVAGMICSFVVEASIRGTLWRAKGRRFRIMWLQQGASVNDQDIDSYAIFAEGEHDSVMKSYLDQGGSSKPKMSTQTLVIGTLASFIGFIVQLTGFRSMH